MKSQIGMILILSLLASTPFAYAAPVSLDDFEDGDHLGWLQTTVPGGRGAFGSTGVELHNGSQMAFIKHGGKGQDSLSQDFGYSENDILSFDMHAVANTGRSNGGTILHSQSGVVLSFLNFLNAPLGSLSLVNATNPASLGLSSVAVDSAQHNYTSIMSDFAAAAGLGVDDQISKISLEFFATGDFSFGGNIVPDGRSDASVWFDNVSIGAPSAVPVPAAVWLFSSGLLGLVGIARRKTA